ncbi:hypothetical protein KC669_00840 [Candidatus Dojkabacteria bacterium]|uniref:Uncharacterized protein n=1 Tax=Candidatus Dojkabacteria bacterium TaxID=2099670 RepID=A0A955L9L4_9BACT|nr:hypothetical protein [Candidatus Dojkabacteria bacterium]
MNKEQKKLNTILQIWLSISVFLMLLGLIFIFRKNTNNIDIDVSDTGGTSLILHAKAGACLGDFTADSVVDVEDVSFFIKVTGLSPSGNEKIFLTQEFKSLNLDTQDTNYWDIRDYEIFEKNFEKFTVTGDGNCEILRTEDI